MDSFFQKLDPGSDEHFGGHTFGGHHLVGAFSWWENFFGEANLVDSLVGELHLVQAKIW